MQQARDAGGLGALPLKVLSAGKQTKPRWVPPDYSDAEYSKRWNGLQEKLRHLTEPPAKRRIAEHSGHEIPIQQPEIVLAAVEELLRSARPAKP
jgi:hypothetical protein